MRDYSTWVKHRNKKGHTEKHRKDRVTLSPLPSPKPGQPGVERHFLYGKWNLTLRTQILEWAHTSTRPIPTALGGCLWDHTNLGPQPPSSKPKQCPKHQASGGLTWTLAYPSTYLLQQPQAPPTPQAADMLTWQGFLWAPRNSGPCLTPHLPTLGAIGSSIDTRLLVSSSDPQASSSPQYPLAPLAPASTAPGFW